MLAPFTAERLPSSRNRYSIDASGGPAAFGSPGNVGDHGSDARGGRPGRRRPAMLDLQRKADSSISVAEPSRVHRMTEDPEDLNALVRAIRGWTGSVRQRISSSSMPQVSAARGPSAVAVRMTGVLTSRITLVPKPSASSTAWCQKPAPALMPRRLPCQAATQPIGWRRHARGAHRLVQWRRRLAKGVNRI